MSSADLTRLACWGRYKAVAVVLSHVNLELFGVSAGGRLPARVLFGMVEVVWQVLALAVAHFPVGREAGFGRIGGHSDCGGQESLC